MQGENKLLQADHIHSNSLLKMIRRKSSTGNNEKNIVQGENKLLQADHIHSKFPCIIAKGFSQSILFSLSMFKKAS